jgi:hypothetical protein
MTPSEISCMHLLEKMGILYGESSDTLLCQKFHYELIST